MSDIGRNEPSDGGGFVTLFRDIRTHWLVGFGRPVRPADPMRGAHSMGEAFIDLMMECQYKENTVNNGGVKMTLQPGQLIGAVSWLATRWNWTPKTVRNYLDNLEADGMLQKISAVNKDGKQKGKQASVLSLCNYEYYQRMHIKQGQANGLAEGKQGASEGQARGNIYNKLTKIDNYVESHAREREPAPPATGAASGPIGLDMDVLSDRLIGACNGALDNPVNCQGLLNLSTPLMWLDQGCDLDRDILPTLVAVGKARHGARIRSWGYFSGAIAKARDARLAGLPPPDAGRTAKKSPHNFERDRALLAKLGVENVDDLIPE